ncbi:hypothetical protein BJX61DRAFT_494804 [Aspergillus egyptiacus]|nr:hypothetical protein BJX61DRAFT_494804 [Aspergillus egyptiacus]
MGGCVSACGFGFSRSVVVALGARLFGGLVNPNVGVVAACVAELVEVKSLQGWSPALGSSFFYPLAAYWFMCVGKAFSIVPFLRGLGCVYPSFCSFPFLSWCASMVYVVVG